MKRLLKSLIYMVLPLSLSACSGFNFGGNSNNNSNDGYTVVDRIEARDFGNEIYNGESFNHFQAQYKYKYKENNNSSQKTGGPLEYEGNYDSVGNYWSVNWENDEYGIASTSFWPLSNYYSFNNTIRNIKNNELGEYNIRYSIDKSNKKIKIEAVQQNDLFTNKIRLEYDASLYLRASLVVNTDNGTGYDLQVNSMYKYSFNNEYDWLGDTYEIYTDFGDVLRPNQDNWLVFYYRSNYHGNDYLPIRQFINYGVITYIDVYNADYYYIDENAGINVRPTPSANQLQIRIGMYDGNYFNFRFEVAPSIYDLAEWMPITAAISGGYRPNSKLFATNVWVSSFGDYGMATPYGSYIVRDEYGNEYAVQTSTLRPESDWFSYDGNVFSYQYFEDFYSYAPLGTQYGREFYPDSLMIGDMLQIFYLVENNYVSFAFIQYCEMQNRMMDRYVQLNDLAEAFNHAAIYGEGKYVYENIPMRVTSFYGTNTNPTQYGDFVVHDMNGNGPYTIYGCTIGEEPRYAFRYNQAADKFTFTNPKNFMNLDYIIGWSDDMEIRPRDLIPGDTLWLTFIINNNMMVGVITGVSLCSRQAKPEPETLTLSLSQIFERSDANSERLYITQGYISSFSTYGMYIKETMDSMVAYYVYNATLNTNCFTFNSTTGLYEFSGRENFGQNHGDLKIGDQVQMLVTRNDYQGTPELIGCVLSFNSAQTCYQITSDIGPSIDLVVGNTIQLTYTCWPSEAAVRATFYSDNPNVASVDSQGLVTGISAGMSTSIWLNIDGCLYSWQINVKGDSTSEVCYSLYSDEREIHLNLGSVYALSYTCEPADARNRAVYHSSDVDVVEVDASGVLYARGIGNATVTVSIDNKSLSWMVYVEQSQVYCQSISSDYSEVTIYPGETFQLSYTVYPAETTSQAYFVSNDASIVTVDSYGLLIGIALGQTNVYVTIDGVFYYWTVNVIGESTVEYAQYIESNYSEYSMEVGQQVQLDFTVIPSERAAYANFQSDNTSVVTIDSSGLMTAVGVGSTVITMNVDHVFHTWNVHVSEPYIACESITSTESYIEIGQWEYVYLEYFINPSTISSTVTFSSSDENIATVDFNGSVYGLNIGTAIITATADGASYSWTIVVKERIQNMGFNTERELFLEVGETYLPSYICEPSDAFGRIVFYSDNPGVADIDANGLITAVGRGITYVRMYCDGWTLWIPVHVNDPSNEPDTCETIISYLTDFSIGYDENSFLYLEYFAYPYATEGRAVFSSSDDSIATVENGYLVMHSFGYVDITVTIDSVSYVWHIFIAPDVNQSNYDIYLSIGESCHLDFSSSFSNLMENCYFISHDDSIATVDENGNVTAVGSGVTYISLIYDGYVVCQWCIQVS